MQQDILSFANADGSWIELGELSQADLPTGSSSKFSLVFFGDQQKILTVRAIRGLKKLFRLQRAGEAARVWSGYIIGKPTELSVGGRAAIEIAGTLSKPVAIAVTQPQGVSHE